MLPSTSGRFHTTKKYYTALPPSSVKIPQKYNSKFSHYLQYTHAYLVVASQVIKRKSNGGKKKHTPKTFEKINQQLKLHLAYQTLNTGHNIWGWPPKKFLKFCIYSLFENENLTRWISHRRYDFVFRSVYIFCSKSEIIIFCQLLVGGPLHSALKFEKK